MKKISIVSIALFCLGIGIGKAQFKNLLNFNGTNGKNPTGSLTLSGGKLFGMAPYGGAYNDGCIFSMDTNGNQYTDLFDFDSLNGAHPKGSLIISGNVMYGMTYIGGNYPGAGDIFSIHTDGSSYKDLYDFNLTLGAQPYGSLTLIGNELYGLACGGGLYNNGCIFCIDTNGSGYRDIYDFDYPGGITPYGNLTFSNGKLYGETGYGGPYNDGNIFSVDTSGKGYTDLYDFNSGGCCWGYPSGSLIVLKNKLYGMTPYAGANLMGCIFSMDTNGKGYKDMFDFTPQSGSNPCSSLTLSGGVLFGMAFESYYFQRESIFSIDTDGSRYINLFDVGDTNDSYPAGALIISGNTLYGMAMFGGAYDSGTAFSFTLNCNTYNEPICIATLDTSNNKNKIIWGRTNSPPASGYGHYNIYKDTGRGYVLLQSQPLDSLSEYVDTSYTWGPVSYQLSTVDSCGESSLSPVHTTIFLTTSASLNAYNLSWTAYQGFTPTQYRIFRGPSLSALKQIDSVANNVLSYTDSFPPINSIYVIEAVSPNGVCIPTTHKPNNRLSASLSGSFSNGFNTATLGVQSINASVSKLNIYPNPSSGLITLTYSLNGGGNVRTTIVNELGQIVYDNTAQKGNGNITEQLNLGSLASGIYSLRLQTDNSIMVRKVVLMGNR